MAVLRFLQILNILEKIHWLGNTAISQIILKFLIGCVNPTHQSLVRASPCEFTVLIYIAVIVVVETLRLGPFEKGFPSKR